MTILIIIALATLYLAGVATQIAVAGHFHGVANAKQAKAGGRYVGGDYFRGERVAWKKQRYNKNWCVATACASPIWPVLLPLALAATVIGGAGWSLIVGVGKLFKSQSDRAVTIADRREDMKSLESSTTLKKVA